MRIAAFQFASGESVAENMKAIARGVVDAAQQGVRLLLLHECAVCGYPPIETPDIAVIDFDAVEAAIREIQSMARAHGMYIAVGTIRREAERRYNSLLLIGPDGETMGMYDKRTLWGWDLNHFTKGDSAGVFVIDGITVGLRVCFEVRFPELFRELLRAKAQLCLISFSDVMKEDNAEHYEVIKAHLRSRAAENVMTVVSTNSVSMYQTAPSVVFGIDGEMIKEAPKHTEHLLVYDYALPVIGYSAKGRLENAAELLRRDDPAH